MIWSWKEPSFPPKSRFTVELLKEMAAKATVEAGKSTSDVIVCTYKGQKQKGSRQYEQEPSKWKRDAPKYQVTLVFEWSRKDKDGNQFLPEIVSVRDDNLMKRGIPQPEKSAFSVESLRKQAADATRKAGKLAGSGIVWIYKGQKQKGKPRIRRRAQQMEMQCRFQLSSDA